MSKRVDISSINPDLVIEQAKKSNREQKSEPVLSQVVLVETVQPETAPVVVAAEPVMEPEPPKEESKRKKNKAQEWKIRTKMTPSRQTKMIPFNQ